MTDAVKNKIRTFVVENLLFASGQDGFNDASSLLEIGAIDSMGVIELVEYLEKTFTIKVADEDIIPQHMDSIDAITNYVATKTG